MTKEHAKLVREYKDTVAALQRAYLRREHNSPQTKALEKRQDFLSDKISTYSYLDLNSNET